jgi:PAS domain S-box-containing protein
MVTCSSKLRPFTFSATGVQMYFRDPFQEPHSRGRRHFLQIATAIPLIGLAVLLISLMYTGSQFLKANRLLAQSDQAIAELHRLQKEIIDSETGIRGFQLTKDVAFLEPFKNSQTSLPKTFREFGGLVSALDEEPSQATAMKRLEATFQNWTQLWREDGARSDSMTTSIRGKTLMDDMRKQIDSLQALQYERKLRASTSLQSALHWFIGLGVGLSILIAVGFALAARQVFQSITKVYSDSVNEGRREYASALKASEERFRTYAEAMPQMAFIAAGNGDIIYYNQKWYDYVGIADTEGWGWGPILHPEDLDPTTERWKLSLSSGKPYEMEYRLRRNDGEYRWHLGRALPIRGSKNEVVQWIGTNTDIQDQRIAIEAARASKEAAENANRLKANFLANVSHEMRTPLGIMIGALDLLKNEEESNSEREKFTELIDRNTRQLHELINELLDVAKVEANVLHTEITQFSFKDFINELHLNFAKKASAKSLGFNIQIDGQMPDLLSSDRSRLKQILNHVVGNAIKFTSAGKVDVVVQTVYPLNQGGRAQIEFLVCDTGIGISTDQCERLFEPFGQADSSSSRRFGGTGLGLVLSRQFAQALGGGVELKLSSSAGSHFRIWVLDAGIAPSQATAKQAQSSLPPSAAPLSGLKILVVDDSPDNLFLLSRFLIADGAHVITAENGIVAIEKCLSSHPDLILMDLQMPVMDGHSATVELRAKGFTNPIFAVTAHAMKNDRDRALAEGFTAYLTKPIDRQRLIMTIAEFAAKDRATPETVS